MNQHQQNLRLLHDRLDAFFGRVMERYADRMMCGAGCSGCCQQSLSVFTVEMDRLLEGVDALPSDARERLGTRVAEALHAVCGGAPPEDVPCVLLEDDRCVVYDWRPSICRSHGAPVHLPRDIAEPGYERDVCPLNFATGAPSLAELPASDLLDLDKVNQTLAVISRLASPGGEPRRDITAGLAAHLCVPLP